MSPATLPPTHCLTAEQLRELAAGRTTGAAAAEWEAHLLVCPACAEQASRFDPTDPLVALLRTGNQPVPEWMSAESSLLHELIDTCISLRTTREDDETACAVSESAIRPDGRDPTVVIQELSASWRPAEAPDELGRIGNYRLLRLLGAGGMGAVFLAEDIQLRRPVALKLMRPKALAEGAANERFLREARAAAALRHDHILNIHQVGEERGVQFLAMEFLEGESLDARLKREPILPLGEALRIGREIAEGLATAHAKGLIHRDIKPANIWLEERGGRVKILDFGLARVHEDDSQLTSSGMIVGTPANMSPEQAGGDPLDGRTDLFSLGVLLYQMTTGVRPFLGKNVLDTLKRLATLTPPKPCDVNPQIPAKLSAFIEQLLEKEPQRRTGSAEEAARQLTALRDSLSADDAATRTPSIALRLGIGAAVFLGLAMVIVQPWNHIAQTPPAAVTSAVVAPANVTVPSSVAGKLQEAEVSSHASAGPYGLDHLFPEAIPVENRSAWFPDEIVASLGAERTKHWFGITAVAFHPSGQFFLSCGQYGPAEAWSTETLERLDLGLPSDHRVLGGERQPVFAPNGKRLFGFGDVYNVEETSSGRPQFQWAASWPNQNRGFPKVVSPDGSWLLESRQTLLEAFDISGATPRSVRTLPLPESCGFVQQLSLSAAGRRLAIGGTSATLLWNVEWEGAGGPELSPVGAPLPASPFIALSPAGDELVTGGRLYRVSDAGQASVVIEGLHSGGPPAFSPDGSCLAVLTHLESHLYQRRESGWTLTQTLNGAFPNVGAATFSPDSHTLVVGDMTGYIHVWDVSVQPAIPKNRPDETSLPLKVAFSPDGKFLAEIGWNGGAVWDLARPVPERTSVANTQRPEGLPPTLGFSHDSQWIAFPPGIWSVAGPARGPSLKFATPRTNFFFTTGPELMTLSFDNNQEVRAVWQRWSISRNGNFALQDVTREFWQPCDFHEDLIEAFRLGLECGSKRVVTRVGTMWRVWDLDSPDRPVREFESKSHTLPTTWRLSPDGRRLLMLARNSPAFIWDLDDLESTPQPFEGPMEIAEFLPHGDRLIVSWGTQLAIRNVETGAELRSWQLPGAVLAIAPHPDGRHFATITANHSIQIWRIP